MPADTSVFHKLVNVEDVMRQRQAEALAQQVALAKLQSQAMGRDLPATIQIANELQRARGAGNTGRINDLLLSGKLADRGLMMDETGAYTQLPGYGQALGGIAATKKGLETQAQKQQELTYDPQIARAEADEKNLSNLNYGGQIAQSEAKARAIGTAQGETQGNIDKKYLQAGELDTLVKEAKKILPSATSGALEGLVTGAAGMAGRSTQASRADRALNVIGAKLTASVPRFEGPQGVLDVQLYEKAAGDVANRNIPYEDRIAALEVISGLNSKYLGAADSVGMANEGQSLNSMVSAPQKGAEVGGYMFMGGNPNDQKNWKVVK